MGKVRQVAEILIREVDPQIEERLRQRAQRHGRTLEAELRVALEQLARDEEERPIETIAPFGSWLVSISRPGVELEDTLTALRSAPVRSLDLD